MSFTLDSCVPAPVCQDRTMKLDSTDSIVDMSRYFGDPDEADWVAQGEPVTRNGNVLLTMPRDSVGTVLASTVYMWYGTVKARMKSSRGPGVVTGFILLSDVKDEIDYEWVGVDLEATQTNYFFQGIPLRKSPLAMLHASRRRTCLCVFADFLCRRPVREHHPG